LEHPETGLDAPSRSKLGQRICRAVARGVQVIVETHCDHVFNGLRIGVRAGIVKPESLIFHHLTRDEEGSGTSSIQSLRLDRDGRFDHWPTGFFDEFDKFLDQMLEPVDTKNA
jgi:predicted ATPase